MGDFMNDRQHCSKLARNCTGITKRYLFEKVANQWNSGTQQNGTLDVLGKGASHQMATTRKQYQTRQI